MIIERIDHEGRSVLDTAETIQEAEEKIEMAIINKDVKIIIITK